MKDFVREFVGKIPILDHDERVTVKAAKIVGDGQFEYFIALSINDYKPVYFISMACEELVWKQKERKVWSSVLGKFVVVPFLCLNVIDDYSNKMNNVDIADQLQGVYCFDHCIRKRKWWWEIWFWAFQMLLTNCYIVYCKYLILHDHEGEIMTQYEFRTKIALAWIDPDNCWPKCASASSYSSAVACSSVSSTSTNTLTQSARKMDAEKCKRKQNTKFSDHSLCPDSGVM